ncbi:MAG TPA: gliding motility-associated ABC transporter permease subunit GldF, partial [Bacteroidales bacterium]|nr:gliding motility-associated ABC transporter permease subunit GldF [Bacteroidales bacterium]
MFTLLKKELNFFFNSLIGYIVVGIFLVGLGLFLWFFNGQFNILDMGYANLDSLFLLSPWIFLFLIPAITMRMFAEEKNTGTIELLLTRPINDITIIFAKFFAAIIIVFIAILPTFIYFLTIYFLAIPIGNVDIAGITGSFIGLFFLAAVYTAIGIFSSSITKNQIIAFIVALLLSFFFYSGFSSVGSLKFIGEIGDFISKLGISAHYKSISRGVIDSRDITYFISVIAIFIFF